MSFFALLFIFFAIANGCRFLILIVYKVVFLSFCCCPTLRSDLLCNIERKVKNRDSTALQSEIFFFFLSF